MTDMTEFEMGTALEHPEDVETAFDHPDEEHHEHPSDWVYVKIAAILGVITAIEVMTYFDSVLDWGDALIPSLILMMFVKFWLVAAFFMHLRFDNPIFTRFFVGGLALAAAVYIVMLTVFRFW